VCCQCTGLPLILTWTSGEGVDFELYLACLTLLSYFITNEELSTTSTLLN
jgi:hypothetical protein